MSSVALYWAPWIHRNEINRGVNHVAQLELSEMLLSVKTALILGLRAVILGRPPGMGWARNHYCIVGT